MTTRVSLPLRTSRLGRVEYVETAMLQRQLRAAREGEDVEDVLLLLQHDDVITCGARTEPQEVAYARTRGVPIVPVERGGKATWHGPGQLVAYPIVDVAIVDGDVKQLVWRLEQAIVQTLADHGIAAARRPGYPGVWVDALASRPRKIASVGLRLTRGVTFHGIAINVTNDLAPFGWFTPCGLTDASMTSVARELESTAADRPDDLVRSVEESFVAHVIDLFGWHEQRIEPSQLRAIAGRHPVPQPELSLPGEPRAQRSHRHADAAVREQPSTAGAPI